MLAAAAFALFALTLDGHSAGPQRALVVEGRTLLPIRAFATALGASVDYRAAQHTIIVRRRGRTAEVNAPRIAGGRAYVPLRAAAAALGMSAAYDARTRTIALTSAATAAVLPAAPAAPAALISQRYPQPDARIADGYPAISALIAPQGGAAVAPGAVRLLVDGRDVSALATMIGDEIVYTPHDALTNGTHQVHIDGVDRAGTAFVSDWSFTTNYDVPLASANYGEGLVSVYVDRYLQPGERYFDVIAHAPAGGYGYVTLDDVPGSYQLFAQGIDRYVAHVTLPLGLNVPFARAYVHFTDRTGNIVNYTLPSTLALYTYPYAGGYGSYGPGYAAPAQTATPAPHPTLEPGVVRRTIAAPSPAPRSSAQPSPAASPPAHVRRPLGRPQPRITPIASPKSIEPS